MRLSRSAALQKRDDISNKGEYKSGVGGYLCSRVDRFDLSGTHGLGSIDGSNPCRPLRAAIPGIAVAAVGGLKFITGRARDENSGLGARQSNSQ